MNDDDRTWTPTHETPDETLRALIRRLDAGTATDEIIRLASIHSPGWRATETRVEIIRERGADEHELARAHRWFDEQDDHPAITLTDERRLCPVDTDGRVHRAEIDAIVAHRLGGRARRTCENPGGVIGCHGPNGYGYRCPDCCQQRRREQAIIDELLLTYRRAQSDDARLLPGTETNEQGIDDTHHTAHTDGGNH